MRTRRFLLVAVLATMFGATSAVAWAEETADTTPEANTGFVAEVTIEDETTYIKYHICGLNPDTDGCGDLTEDDFDTIEVFLNEDNELNHGSFVSAFAQGFEGPGKGCILRYVAQSNWGKEGADDLDLIEAQTFCAFNRDGGEEAEGEDADNGRPAWAGKGKPDFAGNNTAGGPPSWAGTPGGPKGAADSDD
jgi:hypothetical protein